MMDDVLVVVYRLIVLGVLGETVWSALDEDDGYVQGDKYPLGPFRADNCVQRGSVQYLFQQPGDPLTIIGYGGVRISSGAMSNSMGTTPSVRWTCSLSAILSPREVEAEGTGFIRTTLRRSTTWRWETSAHSRRSIFSRPWRSWPITVIWTG